MRPRNRVSSAGLDLVKRFEGYRRQAAQLPDGRWTIGYGHTLTAREGAQVSEADAEALLQYDLHSAGKAVEEVVFTPLNQNQFDALCSFAFNLGADEFRTSDVLKRLNEGGIVQAACAMEMWRKAEFEGEEIVVDALVRRRAAEKILFLTPPGDAFVPAPSPVLRPRVDPGAEDLVPYDTPTQLSTSLYGDSVVVTRGEAPPEPPPPEPQPPEPQPPEPAPSEFDTPEPAPAEPASEFELGAFELAPEAEAEADVEPPSSSEADLLPEPPVDRVTAAAEAVTARLETLFADAPEHDPEFDPHPEADPEPEPEPEPAPEPEPEAASDAEPATAERADDEEAFIEAFIEAPAQLEAPPQTPQTITPIVMSYPVAPPMAPLTSTFQPSFTIQPSSAPISAQSEFAPEPEPQPEPDAAPAAAEPDVSAELHAEPETADLVAEPLDDDDPPLSFEPPESDLWGDDEEFIEPVIDATPEATEDADDLELAPAAEVPPPRALDDDDVDTLTRRPQPAYAPQQPMESPRDRPPFAENTAVRDFLPQRPPRTDRKREPGLLTDLFLALLGIAFFGFAVFWALNAKTDPTGPGVHPSLIAWPTGFIGIGFVVVAIFRLLERLGDAAERD